MRSTLFALAAASLFATAAQAAPATYAIDPTHTFATFEIDHFGASTNRARFDKKSGNVQFDKAGKTGKVDVELDMTSVNSGTAGFDNGPGGDSPAGRIGFGQSRIHLLAPS